MLRKPFKILGINPGTRYLGIAIFEEGQLLDWGVKVAKEKWSKQKKEKVVGTIFKIIEQYTPAAIAVKKLHPAHSSHSLCQLADEIACLAKRKRLKVHRYSIDEIKSFFCKDKRINRLKLAEIVCSAYPVLYHELEKEKTSRNLYHLRMFEAVALGSICFNRLDKCYHVKS
jgi:Holliday junction resolvasome RuvABC endonuclease subunit